jgi:hypothetical protein
LGVAHAAIGSFGDSPGSGIIESDALLVGDVLQVLGDGFRGDGPKVKALAAGDNRGKDFGGFGGGKNKFNVIGRFFEGLE